jgi:UDP-2,3-diacylglucosamine hydrolase
MAKTFFIADLHLSIDNPQRTGLALSFLDRVIREKADLYIVGDLFDFWANNHQIKRSFSAVLNKLSELTSLGLKAGFLFGNRDFLINQKTLEPFGVNFLAEETEINLDGRRVFLTHGHTLCLSDLEFLQYKQKMWPLFRRLDRILPGMIENFIARKFILKSKRVIQSQNPSRFQFTMELIENKFRKGIDIIICGHAHRMQKTVSGEHAFYVLPPWDDNKGGYLLYDNGDFTLNDFLQ